MDELKIPEERNDPKKASGWPFSKKEWTEAWKQLEERARQRPGLHLLVALVIGYFLQNIPFRSLFVLTLKFCLILARPVLFMACAFQLAKYVIKHSNSGDRATLNRATNLADIERHVLFAEALLKMSLRHGEPDWHAHASGFPVGG